MESFYSQLLIVLVLIVAVLICVLIYRKMTQLMESGHKNEDRDVSEKGSQSHYEKLIHPRISLDEESQSTEVNDGD